MLTDDIIDFIIRNIDNGRYIYTSVDEYFIPGKEAYKAYSNIHDFFIFGYDLEKRQLHVAGFFNRLYSQTTVGFDVFLEGFWRSENIEDPSPNPNYSSIYTLEFNLDTETSINIPLIRNMITDYLNSYDSSKRVNMYNYNNDQSTDLKYGLEVYSYLLILLEEIESGRQYFDVKPFQLLWEHKKIMLSRIVYLSNIVTISENTLKSCEELINLCQVMRNQMLKYEIIQKNSHLKKIRLLIEQTHSLDSEFTIALLNDLSK